MGARPAADLQGVGGRPGRDLFLHLCACGVAWRLYASAACSAPSQSSRRWVLVAASERGDTAPSGHRHSRNCSPRLLVGPGSCHRANRVSSGEQSAVPLLLCLLCPCSSSWDRGVLGYRPARLPGPPLVALSFRLTGTPFWVMVLLGTAPITRVGGNWLVSPVGAGMWLAEARNGWGFLNASFPISLGSLGWLWCR